MEAVSVKKYQPFVQARRFAFAQSIFQLRKGGCCIAVVEIPICWGFPPNGASDDVVPLGARQGRAFQETRLILETTGLTSHIPYSNVLRNFADQWDKT